MKNRFEIYKLIFLVGEFGSEQSVFTYIYFKVMYEYLIG